MLASQLILEMKGIKRKHAPVTRAHDLALVDRHKSIAGEINPLNKSASLEEGIGAAPAAFPGPVPNGRTECYFAGFFSRPSHSRKKG